MASRCRMFVILFVAAAVPGPSAANSERRQAASTECAAQEWIPANVTVEDDFVLAMINEMARRSPSFRDRLLRIGTAPTVRARIRSTQLRIPNIARTQTAFVVNTQGWLFADIQIPPQVVFSWENVEMIAHEIEHVIEQIEGVDLITLAGQRRSGVRRFNEWRGGLFETDRATNFGDAVDREFHHRATGSSCAAALRRSDAGRVEPQ